MYIRALLFKRYSRLAALYSILETGRQPSFGGRGFARAAEQVNKRNHLRHHDALAVATKFFCQWLTTYERDVHEYGIQLDHARELDEFGAWLIGANHYHRLRMTPPNTPGSARRVGGPSKLRAATIAEVGSAL